MHSELGLSRYAGASLALELERTMPMNSLLNGYYRFLLSSLKNDWFQNFFDLLGIFGDLLGIFDLLGNISQKRLCPRKKIFNGKLGHQFFEKTAMSQKKIFQWEKIFKIDIFVLKHVLNHSKSIPTKKNFRKFFDFLVYNFSKKRLCPRKKIFNGKKFSKSRFAF